MSQPQDFGPDEVDPLSKPLNSIDQLVLLFRDCEKPKEQWMIGIEYEMFGQIDHGKRPLAYEGPVSITSFFSSLVSQSKNQADPFLPIHEGENLVGLFCQRAVIALEPGGQIEIAARPHRSLYDVTSIFSDVVKELEIAATALNIELFALGIHPSASREEMAQVKKARYAIMRNYMQRIDGLGVDMMTRSCAIQLNLDYSHELDMAKKTRLGAALVPIYSLLCASSAYIDKKPATHAIERGNVWRKTDPARTGIPAIIFANDFGYESWINMVLDVPMYFIRRGKIYHDVAGASFREYMTSGLRGHQATLRDFIDHLSTVFTEIRLKPILELRSPDALPVPFVNALTALTWALFYHDQAHVRALNIFADVRHQEIINLQNDAINMGRKAQFRGRAIFKVAEEIIAIAQAAVEELATKTTRLEVAKLLKPLANLIEKDITVAEWIHAKFPRLNEENQPGLIRAFSPFNNPL